MSNHKLIAYYLKKFGYRVDFVLNGFEVLSAMETNSYDLIIMDIEMPDMDGFTATRQIREKEKNGIHIPIIALTAHEIQEKRDRCLECGMNGYITKPVDHRELLYFIDKIFHHKKEKSVISDIDIFDKNLLYEHSSGDKELIKDIIDIFLSEVPLLIDDIKSSVINMDTVSLLYNAHKLKGMSIDIGGRSLQSTAGEIEFLVRNRQMETIPEYVRKIEEEFQKLKPLLYSVLSCAD